MASPVEIIDISSDEEDGGDDEVSDWLKAMLGDNDDVVVDELLSAAGAGKGDSDDDCVVLDGDPDRPVEIAGGGGGGGGEDDLLIVGEKGQIACRDYPHPRHLCATFPFSSTPHDKHCNLCHCYVCDTRAPCIYWSTGGPNNDHCHSTDKDSKWKYLRKVFKQRDALSLPPQKLPQPPTQPLPQKLPQPPTQPLPQKLPQPPTQPPTLSSRSNVLRPCPATATISGLSTRHQPPIPAARNSTTHVGGPRYLRNRRALRSPVAHYSNTLPRDPRLIPEAHNVLPQKRSADPIPALVIQQQLKTRKNATWHADPRLRAAPRPHGGPPADLVEENMKTWQNVLDGVAVDLGVGVGVQDTSSSLAFAPLAPPSDPSTVGFRYDWMMNNVARQEAVAGEASVPAVLGGGGLDSTFEFDDPWAGVSEI